MENYTAMKYPRGGQKYVIIGDNEYVFMPQNDISLAYIRNEDVDKLIRTYRNCCGNGSKQQFFLASETDVRRWTYGGR
jgi:hypothetical protein